jgi:hypothetical protein
MVSNANQTTLDSPVNQGVHADTSEPNKIGASTPYDFEARNLTAYGGLLPVATMLEKLGFQQLVEETLTAPHAPASPPTRTRRLQRQAHQRPHQGHRRRALLRPRRRRVHRQPARPHPLPLPHPGPHGLRLQSPLPLRLTISFARTIAVHWLSFPKGICFYAGSSAGVG